MITDSEKHRLVELVKELEQGLNPEYCGNLYDLLDNAYYRCRTIIPELEECHEMAVNYSSTVPRYLKISIQLINDYIVKNTSIHIPFSMPIGHLKDPGLIELIKCAEESYEQGNKQLATEKLWDAFERLKTYYTTMNKRDSACKIVKDMSQDVDEYHKLFDDEFLALTRIGNDYRIRHHETNKIDINDERYYDYFYYRCFSLLSTAVKFL